MPRTTKSARPAAKSARKPMSKGRKPASGYAKTQVTSSRYSAPAAYGTTTQRSSLKSTTMVDKERIASVAGAVTFTATNQPINAGLPAMFPQLSGHAALFDQYRFKYLVVKYKTNKGTTAAGNIMMAWDSDPADQAPADAIAMSNQAICADGPVWKEIALKIPCDNKWRFTRSSAVVNADIKSYDHGRFISAMEGCVDASQHGYFEVSFTVEFKEKTPALTTALSTNRSVSQFISTNAVVASNGFYNFTPATNPVNALAGVGGITLPAGSYYVTFRHHNVFTMTTIAQSVAMLVSSGNVTTLSRGTGMTVPEGTNSGCASWVFSIMTPTVIAFQNASALGAPGSHQIQVIIELL